MIQIKFKYLLIAGFIAVFLSSTGLFLGMVCDASGHTEAAGHLKFNTGILEGISLTCFVLLLICKKEK